MNIGTNDEPINNFISMGEMTLALLNDDKEWKKLMEHLRSSGVTTNNAARMMILSYFQSKNDMGDAKKKTQRRLSKKQPKQNGEFWEQVLTDMEPKVDNDILTLNVSDMGYEKETPLPNNSFYNFMENMKQNYASMSELRTNFAKGA